MSTVHAGCRATGSERMGVRSAPATIFASSHHAIHLTRHTGRGFASIKCEFSSVRMTQHLSGIIGIRSLTTARLCTAAYEIVSRQICNAVFVFKDSAITNRSSFVRLTTLAASHRGPLKNINTFSVFNKMRGCRARSLQRATRTSLLSTCRKFVLRIARKNSICTRPNLFSIRAKLCARKRLRIKRNDILSWIDPTSPRQITRAR
jgi:hypothetical protein